MRGRLRRMTQNMVMFCRLNTGTVPHEVVTKVIGDEYRQQVRREVYEEIEGERERARSIAEDRCARMRREVDSVKHELAHPPLIRRVMEPVETLWAWIYAVAREVPPAAIERVVDRCVRAGLLRRVDEGEV